MRSKFKIIAFVFVVLVCINIGAFAQVKTTIKCKPEVYLGTHTGTSEITKAELITFKELTVKNNCNDGSVFLGFDLTTIVNGGTVICSTNSMILHKDMTDAINQVKVGSKIFIDNVRIKKPDGTIKVIPGITIKVK